MAVPKKKMSKSRTGCRRAHDFLEKPSSGTCSNCGEVKKTHRICPKCGFYNGKQYKTGTED